jgi:hypothetical protein
MNKELITIGRMEMLHFPELELRDVHARIDTGAKTSTVWASNISAKDGWLSFTLFDATSDIYSGQTIRTQQFSQLVVTSSTGVVQRRYVVKLLVEIHGRKIRGSFTLADRSSQVYPILVGRNVLRGKFVVDVRLASPVPKQIIERSNKLQNLRERKEIK